MATEDRRIVKMFYLLSKTGGYLKSNELAQMLQLSERTVKGDIEQLKIFTRENGGSLESVRGKGYCLKAVDPPRFQQAKERVEILFSNIDKGHKENQVYHIARAVMRFEGADEEGYFRLEQLADRLYLSPSAIKKEMPGVRDFLGSFNLSLPGLERESDWREGNLTGVSASWSCMRIIFVSGSSPSATALTNRPLRTGTTRTRCAGPPWKSCAPRTTRCLTST